jgi:flavin-dependent dehydrogenase
MVATSEAMPTRTDIIVAGGGPAGTTIARLLVGFGFHVVLLEKRRFPRHQIGESLTPQILPILDFLGVRTRVEAAGFLRMVGHTVCWGSSQPRTSYYSTDHTRRGFQVWRADFDQLLLEYARSSGVQVIEEQAVDSVYLDGGGGVTVRTPQGQLEALFFVDASGHTGVLARQGLRQRDDVFQTLAVTGYWQGAAGPAGIDFANTLLETYAEGLVWSVPLHNGLRNVTFLIDWQRGARIRQTGLGQFYLSELQKVPYVSGFLQGAQLAWPASAFDASWYTASAFAGERFLLVGDAGLFIDPLSSEGVHKAMASAISGAVVVNTILRRPTMARHAISFYDESQYNTYDSHYRQSALYYREEGRWPDHPFWRRRSQTQSSVLSPQSSVLSPQSVSDPQPLTPSPQRVSHLRLAPGVTIEPRPVIEGPYVELREVVVAPPYPRGVRFLQHVCVPTLLRAVEAKEAVADVIAAYLQSAEGRHCPPESVRQVLARLYQEGVLVAAESTAI